MKKSLVVLSGGQDSMCCLAIAIDAAKGDPTRVAALTFDYGQRHHRELAAARDVCKLFGVKDHEVLALGPVLKGTSPLTDKNAELEQYADFAAMDKIIGNRVETTFVPMRNALFLTIAANRAVCLGATEIYVGVCQADNANYPDCTADFIDFQENAINVALGTYDNIANRITIVTPLMHKSKAQAIQDSAECGYYLPLAFTHTSYDGSYPPVGHDHATLLRAQGFLESGYPDPLVIRAYMDGVMELPKTPNYDLDLASMRTGINILHHLLQSVA